MSKFDLLPSMQQVQDSMSVGYHSMHDKDNTGRFVQVMIDGYHWVKKNLPSAGANQFAFDSQALAESTPIGPGVRQRNFWQTMAAPLIYPGQTAATAGYGGVITGQFLSQPLYDPYADMYGNTQGNP